MSTTTFFHKSNAFELVKLHFGEFPNFSKIGNGGQKEKSQFSSIFRNFKIWFKIPQNCLKLWGITFYNENNTFEQIKPYFEKFQNSVRKIGNGRPREKSSLS